MFLELVNNPLQKLHCVRRPVRMTAWIGWVLLATIGLPSEAAGDVVWMKNGEVHYGVVDIESEEAIEFKVWSENGFSKSRSLPRSEIVSLVVSIDKPRMAALAPGSLESYRDYAEELFGQQEDPVAKRLAIRLYLIVAFADTSEAGALRRNALRMLPKLARNGTEQRKFLLLQAIHSESESKLEQSNTRVPPVDTAGNEQLLLCLQHLRRGETLQASELLGQPAVKNAALRTNDVCSLAELQEMVVLNRLAPEQLERLLRLERFLKHPETSTLRKVTDDWGVQSRFQFGIWAQVPTFQNVTEFDPAKDWFRNGDWVAPARR